MRWSSTPIKAYRVNLQTCRMQLKNSMTLRKSMTWTQNLTLTITLSSTGLSRWSTSNLNLFKNTFGKTIQRLTYPWLASKSSIVDIRHRRLVMRSLALTPLTSKSFLSISWTKKMGSASREALLKTKTKWICSNSWLLTRRKQWQRRREIFSTGSTRMVMGGQSIGYSLIWVAITSQLEVTLVQVLRALQSLNLMLELHYRRSISLYEKLRI